MQSVFLCVQRVYVCSRCVAVCVFLWVCAVRVAADAESPQTAASNAILRKRMGKNNEGSIALETEASE